MKSESHTMLTKVIAEMIKEQKQQELDATERKKVFTEPEVDIEAILFIIYKVTYSDKSRQILEEICEGYRKAIEDIYISKKVAVRGIIFPVEGDSDISVQFFNLKGQPENSEKIDLYIHELKKLIMAQISNTPLSEVKDFFA